MARAFQRRGYLSQVENYCWPENFLRIFLQKKKLLPSRLESGATSFLFLDIKDKNENLKVFFGESEKLKFFARNDF